MSMPLLLVCGGLALVLIAAIVIIAASNRH